LRLVALDIDLEFTQIAVRTTIPINFIVVEADLPRRWTGPRNAVLSILTTATARAAAVAATFLIYTGGIETEAVEGAILTTDTLTAKVTAAIATTLFTGTIGDTDATPRFETVVARRTFPTEALAPIVTTLFAVTFRSADTLPFLAAFLRSIAGPAVPATAITAALTLLACGLAEAGAVGQADLTFRTFAATAAAAVIATLFLSTSVVTVSLADPIDAHGGSPGAFAATSVTAIITALFAVALWVTGGNAKPLLAVGRPIALTTSSTASIIAALGHAADRVTGQLALSLDALILSDATATLAATTIAATLFAIACGNANCAAIAQALFANVTGAATTALNRPAFVPAEAGAINVGYTLTTAGHQRQD